MSEKTISRYCPFKCAVAAHVPASISPDVGVRVRRNLISRYCPFKCAFAAHVPARISPDVCVRVRRNLIAGSGPLQVPGIRIRGR
jgi:hypothetical protein